MVETSGGRYYLRICPGKLSYDVHQQYDRLYGPINRRKISFNMKHEVKLYTVDMSLYFVILEGQGGLMSSWDRNITLSFSLYLTEVQSYLYSILFYFNSQKYTDTVFGVYFSHCSVAVPSSINSYFYNQNLIICVANVSRCFQAERCCIKRYMYRHNLIKCVTSIKPSCLCSTTQPKVWPQQTKVVPGGAPSPLFLRNCKY